MLFGQQLRRRHQHDLKAGIDGMQRCQSRHDGLAAPHIPLHQAQHRLRLNEVALDFFPDACLRTCQRERQVGKELARQLTASRHRPAGIALDVLAEQAEAQLLCQQFFEGKAPLRGMQSRCEQLDAGIGRGPVNVLQC